MYNKKESGYLQKAAWYVSRMLPSWAGFLPVSQTIPHRYPRSGLCHISGPFAGLAAFYSSLLDTDKSYAIFGGPHKTPCLIHGHFGEPHSYSNIITDFFPFNRLCYGPSLRSLCLAVAPSIFTMCFSKKLFRETSFIQAHDPLPYERHFKEEDNASS